ncbi:MobP3 family relaxase [Flavonifractor sp. An10]|uniref:MobP3 family relaxase n=1 Tax=Flavonifractor sp. An10 TaxID=1965537 RepID=UPI000B38B430|nr:MobP3 family relaxase [Flavonifractor sp. An10]OUQ80874.1 hypothetical protein B5E42_13420 [Flavonifractor sp. An10]
MAGLIVKSPYIKGGGAGGYLRYIATRERVEILPDGRPPTRKQEQLIAKLTKDFSGVKELSEYADYTERPTKANASALITMALEEHWEDVRASDGYARYIATRPRAERLGSHGLFGNEDAVDLDAAMAEVAAYQGNIWTHIISLKREDASRLGYDNARAWCTLLRANRYEIAAAMNIPPNHFRWYAAFHDEGEHPHVHMMAWSTQPGEAYLTKEGIRRVKSTLTNQIFRQEMLHTYEQKSQSRDELVWEARRAIRRMPQEMVQSICSVPEIEQKMEQLAGQLETVKGKKSYGYLPKLVKKTVDEVVDGLEELPVVQQCYEQWLVLQNQVDSYYHDSPRVRKKLSQEKEFRQIKNAVIQEAERLRLGEPTFEDGELSERDEEVDEREISFACEELRWLLLDGRLPLEARDQAAERLERLAEQGDAHAQFVMGQLYRDGPLLIPDSQKAKRWFTLAAEHGMSKAQYALGKLLLSADPEVRDPDEGLRWLRRAAQRGNTYAAYWLGKEYLTGEHVPKSTDKSVGCFRSSAEQGNPFAQYMLGKLYLEGKAVSRDQEQSAQWFRRSAAQGNRYAHFFLDRQSDRRPPGVMLSVTRLLHHLGRIFRENAPPATGPGIIQIDRKRLQQLREKRIALGHKPDDHPEQGWGGMGMGGM